MIRKISTSGASLVVVIPKDLAVKKKLSAGDYVEIPDFEKIKKIGR